MFERRFRVFLSGFSCLMIAAGIAEAQSLSDRVNDDYAYLEKLYSHLHSHPELSFHEEQTAARLADELRKAEFRVTEQVGGHGVVGVLENGPGPTILLRTDLDGLPVTEHTGLPDASVVTTTDDAGVTVGVMHACGHDVHMTSVVGAIRLLQQVRDQWSGTLVCIGQPAEERGAGAKLMLEDGLYTRFPRPDYVLGFHADAALAAGSVRLIDGYVYANVNSVDITFYGRGGHGARPHLSIDPVVMAARFIMDVQTLVSREISPMDPAVVTVGSIHGGTKHNIIPDEVHLQLTVRSYSDTVKDHLLSGIKRIAIQAARVSGMDRDPVVSWDEATPSVYNDPELTAAVTTALKNALGPEKVLVGFPEMVGEDFSLYGRAGVPSCNFRLGTVNPQTMAAGEILPGLHSSTYFPDRERTLKTGVHSLAAVLIHLYSNAP